MVKINYDNCLPKPSVASLTRRCDVHVCGYGRYDNICMLGNPDCRLLVILKIMPTSNGFVSRLSSAGQGSVLWLPRPTDSVQ